MNLFILFAPNFNHLAVEVARKAAGHRGMVSGLLIGANDIGPSIRRRLGANLSSLSFLGDLEQAWISEKVDQSDLERIDQVYGAGTFGRVVTADRRLGPGYVTGGRLRPEEVARKPRLTDDQLDSYVVGLFSFFEKQFESQNPHSVLTHAVASAPALALSIVAKKRNLTFATFSHTRVLDRYILEDGIANELKPIQEKFSRLPGRRPYSAEVLQQARKLQADFLLAQEAPQYMSSLIGTNSFSNVLEALRVSTLWFVRFGMKGGSRLEFRRYGYRITSSFRRFLSLKNFRFDGLPGAKFAYFPLHVDPESSTMVQAPHLTNQIAIIEALAKSLPSGYRLVVKEHLPMVGHRPRGFYAALRSLHRVIVVSPETSSFELIKKASFVAVISGTAGFEALRLGKRVLLMGRAPYERFHSGLVVESDFTRLESAISKLLSGDPPDQEELVHWLALVLDSSFAMPAEVMWNGRFRQLNEDERASLIDKIVQNLLLLVQRNKRVNAF